MRKGFGKEIGWYSVYLDPAAFVDLMFGDAPRQFDRFHWHGDIFDLPEGATCLATQT